MNTTRLQENISALTDGELPACDVELTMAALADPQGQAAWDAYRLIGDVLRADAAEVEPAPGFAARLAARLAAERLPGPAVEPAAQGAVDAGAGVDVAGAHNGAGPEYPGDIDSHARVLAGGADAGTTASGGDGSGIPSAAPPAADGAAPVLVR